MTSIYGKSNDEFMSSVDCEKTLLFPFRLELLVFGEGRNGEIPFPNSLAHV
jgi:hypothetical protein